MAVAVQHLDPLEGPVRRDQVYGSRYLAMARVEAAETVGTVVPRRGLPLQYIVQETEEQDLYRLESPGGPMGVVAVVGTGTIPVDLVRTVPSYSRGPSRLQSFKLSRR